MKRESGSKLIEEFLSIKDLRLVVDTSGAYIPGHGTPTVILFGRAQRPVGSTVKAVLGVRGEPGQPADPATGLVWSAIIDHIGTDKYDDTFISITNLPRQTLARHPWSLTGGGASTLTERISDSPRVLKEVIRPPMGGSIRAGADEAFLRPMWWKPTSRELGGNFGRLFSEMVSAIGPSMSTPRSTSRTRTAWAPRQQEVSNVSSGRGERCWHNA